MGGALIVLFLLPMLAFLVVGATTVIMAIFGMIKGPGKLRKRIALWFGLIAFPLIIFAAEDFSGLPETPVGNVVMAILEVIGLGTALFFSLGWFFRWAVSDVFPE